MKQQILNNTETKPLLTDIVRNGVLNNPEYKKYCDYYKIKNINTDKTIMGFCVWKSFGMRV